MRGGKRLSGGLSPGQAPEDSAEAPAQGQEGRCTGSWGRTARLTARRCQAHDPQVAGSNPILDAISQRQGAPERPRGKAAMAVADPICPGFGTSMFLLGRLISE